MRRGDPPPKWSGFPSYTPTVRRLAPDGIRAKSRRGGIGETWWSQRFIAVLESFSMGPRLSRGRSYARSGQVLDLVVGPGLAAARVQGSRVRPYKVDIAVAALSEKDWRRAEDAMASQAIFLASLLAGEMPRTIEEAFAECRLSLFPARLGDLRTSCSCPDWANPCKHIA
ncbi:MAG TPA: SWIM zinc finger family protein, partial [Actinomycetota bacterium]